MQQVHKPQAQVKIQDAQFSEHEQEKPLAQQKVQQNDVFSDLEQQFSQQNETANENADDVNYDDYVQVVNINPKLKTLLLHDIASLKHKISQIPELKELFKDVDLVKLREIVERKEYSQQDLSKESKIKEAEPKKNGKKDKQTEESKGDDLASRLG